MTAGVNTRASCQAQCEVETSLLGQFQRRHGVGALHEAELRVERWSDHVASNVLLHTDTGPQYLRFWWRGEDTVAGGPHDEVRRIRAFLADDTQLDLQEEFFNWRGAAFAASWVAVVLLFLAFLALGVVAGWRGRKIRERREIVETHVEWTAQQVRLSAPRPESEPASTGGAPLVQLRRILQEPPSDAAWRAVRAVLVGVAPKETAPVRYAFDHMREEWSSWRTHLHPAVAAEPVSTAEGFLRCVHGDVIANLGGTPGDDLMFSFHRLVEINGAVVEAALPNLPLFYPPWIPASWLHDRAVAPSTLRSRLAARCPESMYDHHTHAWILVEPCTFTRGSPPSEPGRDGDETQHEVTLTAPFVVAAHPVLREAWTGTPSWNEGDDLLTPVTNISWLEARAHCEAAGVRMLTEAQWECMCRAGTRTATFGGELDEDPEYRDALLWRVAQWRESGRPWGSDRPTANPWGLYRTLGHVAEWTADWYGPYPSGPVTDPSGPAQGSHRVFRGGAWSAAWPALRAADRARAAEDWRNVALGLRVARDVVPPWERLQA